MHVLHYGMDHEDIMFSSKPITKEQYCIISLNYEVTKLHQFHQKQEGDNEPLGAGGEEEGFVI